MHFLLFAALRLPLFFGSSRQERSMKETAKEEITIQQIQSGINDEQGVPAASNISGNSFCILDNDQKCPNGSVSTNVTELNTFLASMADNSTYYPNVVIHVYGDSTNDEFVFNGTNKFHITFYGEANNPSVSFAMKPELASLSMHNIKFVKPKGPQPPPSSNTTDDSSSETEETSSEPSSGETTSPSTNSSVAPDSPPADAAAADFVEFEEMNSYEMDWSDDNDFVSDEFTELQDVDDILVIDQLELSEVVFTKISIESSKLITDFASLRYVDNVNATQSISFSTVDSVSSPISVVFAPTQNVILSRETKTINIRTNGLKIDGMPEIQTKNITLTASTQDLVIKFLNETNTPLLNLYNFNSSLITVKGRSDTNNPQIFLNSSIKIKLVLEETTRIETVTETQISMDYDNFVKLNLRSSHNSIFFINIPQKESSLEIDQNFFMLNRRPITFYKKLFLDFVSPTASVTTKITGIPQEGFPTISTSGKSSIILDDQSDYEGSTQLKVYLSPRSIVEGNAAKLAHCFSVTLNYETPSGNNFCLRTPSSYKCPQESVVLSPDSLNSYLPNISNSNNLSFYVSGKIDDIVNLHTTKTDDLIKTILFKGCSNSDSITISQLPSLNSPTASFTAKNVFLHINDSTEISATNIELDSFNCSSISLKGSYLKTDYASLVGIMKIAIINQIEFTKGIPSTALNSIQFEGKPTVILGPDVLDFGLNADNLKIGKTFSLPVTSSSLSSDKDIVISELIPSDLTNIFLTLSKSLEVKGSSTIPSGITLKSQIPTEIILRGKTSIKIVEHSNVYFGLETAKNFLYTNCTDANISIRLEDKINQTELRSEDAIMKNEEEEITVPVFESKATIEMVYETERNETFLIFLNGSHVVQPKMVFIGPYTIDLLRTSDFNGRINITATNQTQFTGSAKQFLYVNDFYSKEEIIVNEKTLPPSLTSNSGKANVGAIVGGVIAAIVVVALIVAGVYFYKKYPHEASSSSTELPTIITPKKKKPVNGASKMAPKLANDKKFKSDNVVSFNASFW